MVFTYRDDFCLNQGVSQTKVGSLQIVSDRSEV